MDTTELRNKIHDGAYKNTWTYPAKPKRPSSLDAKVSDLTADQLKRVPELRKEHAADLKNWERQVATYNAESQRLDAQFMEDFYEAFGVVRDDPFVIKMFEIAYDLGHSGGYSELTNYFQNLMPLYELHNFMVA